MTVPVGLAATLALLGLTGCGGPFGLRFGLNPEVIAQLKGDPAASCIVIETATAGGTRIIWWRDNSPSREGTSMRDCLDPRASAPVGAPVVR